MAKGAATETALGKVHAQLARVFSKVLEKYENDLNAVPSGELEDELLAEINEPSPAMLSAIAKFLKDNDIGLDTEEVEALSATQRRLEDQRKKRREAGFKLAVVPVVDDAVNG